MEMRDQHTEAKQKVQGDLRP